MIKNISFEVFNFEECHMKVLSFLWIDYIIVLTDLADQRIIIFKKNKNNPYLIGQKFGDQVLL